MAGSPSKGTVNMTIIDDKKLENELRAIIAEIVEIDPDKITLDASFVDDLGMDSMMALEILSEIEKKFKIHIPEDKLSKLRNLKAALLLVKSYI